MAKKEDGKRATKFTIQRFFSVRKDHQRQNKVTWKQCASLLGANFDGFNLRKTLLTTDIALAVCKGLKIFPRILTCQRLHFRRKLIDFSFLLFPWLK